MRLIEITGNTLINPKLVSQIRLDGGKYPQVIVCMADGGSIFLNVPKGQQPEKFFWTVKEWIRTGFHPYGHDKDPEITRLDDATGMFDINMLRAER